MFQTFKQPHLGNRAKKGLKMRSAFSTNFWSLTIFVLTIFDFGWKKFKTTTITTEKTTKTGVQTKLNRKPSKISFYKSVLRNYVGWTQAQQIAASRKCLRGTPLIRPIVPALLDDWMHKRGPTEGFPRVGNLLDLCPSYVISGHTFTVSTFWGLSF